MIKLRTKIEVWSIGIDESLRERNGNFLIDTYLQLPSRRVWLYLKHWRSMLMQDPDNPVPDAEHIDQWKSYFDGPEDVIAKGEHTSCLF